MPRLQRVSRVSAVETLRFFGFAWQREGNVQRASY